MIIKGTVEEIRSLLGVIPQQTEFTWKEEPIHQPEKPHVKRRPANVTGVCDTCGKEYQKTSNVQKRCPICRMIKTRENQEKARMQRKAAKAPADGDTLTKKLDKIRKQDPRPMPRPDIKPSFA